MSTGQKQNKRKKKNNLDVNIFPVFVLENFCPQAFVCTQCADFVRKDLTYCFPASFVIMYITLSNVVHSLSLAVS